MKKINEVREELQGFNEAVANLQKEKMEKTLELQKQKQERQKIVIEQFGAVDGRSLKPFNQAIEQLEKDIVRIEEQLELSDQVKKEKFTPMIQELKDERNQVAQESNEKIQALEKQLFEAKLSFMVELEKAGQTQNELQNEVNEYHEVISMFEVDSREALQKFTIYSPEYLGYGLKSPCAPTNAEVEMLSNPFSRNGRLPFSYLVYRMTGEVIVNEKEAQDRHHELQRGAK